MTAAFFGFLGDDLKEQFGSDLGKRNIRGTTLVVIPDSLIVSATGKSLTISEAHPRPTRG